MREPFALIGASGFAGDSPMRRACRSSTHGAPARRRGSPATTRRASGAPDLPGACLRAPADGLRWSPGLECRSVELPLARPGAICVGARSRCPWVARSPENPHPKRHTGDASRRAAAHRRVRRNRKRGVYSANGPRAARGAPVAWHRRQRAIRLTGAPIVQVWLRTKGPERLSPSRRVRSIGENHQPLPVLPRPPVPHFGLTTEKASETKGQGKLHSSGSVRTER
jgi:hypothetical protein